MKTSVFMPKRKEMWSSSILRGFFPLCVKETCQVYWVDQAVDLSLSSSYPILEQLENEALLFLLDQGNLLSTEVPF